MKIRRFIVEADFAPERITLTDREAVHQMRSVLKLKAGETVILGDGRMNEVECRIVSLGSRDAQLDVVRRMTNAKESKRQVILYCTILKGDHFDLMVQKAVEVGVAEIRPVISKRSIEIDVNLERMAKIAKESAEQCGRGLVPPVGAPVQFDDALRESATSNDVNYFMDANAAILDKGVLGLKDMNRIGVFIGPEGGWDESETDGAKSQGFIPVSLGPLVMRAETAAIVASYLLAANIHVHGAH